MSEAAQPVKVSCRNLWKVYGPRADRLSRSDGLFEGDRSAAC